jgi:hypothetical protein
MKISLIKVTLSMETIEYVGSERAMYEHSTATIFLIIHESVQVDLIHYHVLHDRGQHPLKQQDQNILL